MEDMLRKSPVTSRRAVSLVLVLGVLGSVLGFLHARSNEREPARMEFGQLAVEQHAITRDVLPRYEDAFAGLGAITRNISQLYSIKVGERARQVFDRSRTGWIEAQVTSAPFRWAAAVLLFAALIGGVFYLWGRRSKQIEPLVADREAELAESRRQLESLM
ncbi:MAG: hypothetical protein ABIO94_05790, partial [Opitutaceae bacterium]